MKGAAKKIPNKKMSRDKNSVEVTGRAAGAKEIAAKSATLCHLKEYGTVKDFIEYAGSFLVLQRMAQAVLEGFGVVKAYIVDSPSSPRWVRGGYEGLLKVLGEVDTAFNVLVLQDGVDAFVREFIVNGGTLGPWIAYFALDYIANVFNYMIQGLVLKPLKLVENGNGTSHANGNGIGGRVVNGNGIANGRSAAASAPSSAHSQRSVGSDMPHVRELTNTTNSLRRDISDKYIAPTKSMIESYLEPTKTKIEAQYIHPINERVVSTKVLLNNKYDEFVKPTYEAAYETVSRTYEGKLNSLDSVPRAIVSTGVDLSSKTLEKLKSVTLSHDGTMSTAELTAVADDVSALNGMGTTKENEEIAAA